MKMGGGKSEDEEEESVKIGGRKIEDWRKIE